MSVARELTQDLPGTLPSPPGHDTSLASWETEALASWETDGGRTVAQRRGLASGPPSRRWANPAPVRTSAQDTSDPSKELGNETRSHDVKIQIQTDKDIENRKELTPRVEAEVAEALSHFAEHLTRVEVHLRDESAGRSTGADQRCMLQARPAGQEPVAVTHHAASMDEAVGGALDKMQSLLASKFGRIHDQRTGRTTIDDHLPEL